MKPRSGAASLAATNLVYLIGLGEVALRRSGCFAERLDGSGQIGDDFTNGNQAVLFVGHGFILPFPSDKIGERVSLLEPQKDGLLYTCPTRRWVIMTTHKSPCTSWS